MLSQKKKIVPVLASSDIVSGVDCDSIDLLGTKNIALLCVFGATLSGNPVLTLYSGVAHGDKTTVVTFNYRYGGAAIGAALADVLSAIAASAALTCTGTTFVSRLLVIEVDVDQITDGHRYLTLQVGSCTAGILTVVAVLNAMYQDPGGDSMID
jgi:hypothetical protein